MNFLKTHWRPSLAAVVVLLVIVGWYRHGGESAHDAKAPGAGRETPVDVVPVRRADVTLTAEGLGTVQAFYTVTVTARVDGQLDSVAFAEGQDVRKGDLLAQIDPRPYQAAFDQASGTLGKDSAQLDNARRDLERYLQLAPENLASKQTVDTQRALVAQLEAQVRADKGAVDSAHTQLEYTAIRAPIAGRTGIRHVDPGNIVRAADTGGIVVLTQLQPITVIFSLPEDALPELNSALGHGSVTAIALSRDRDADLDHGQIALVDNQIDQSTGTIRVKATFPNAHRALWPGQFVNVRVLTRVRHQVPVIPVSAVQRGPKGVFTYRVRDDSTVEVAPLVLGPQSGDAVIVEQGLADGDRVVGSNQYRLEPKAKIRANPAPAAGATP